MTAPLPRAEYPRPQCARPDWLCLNGAWQFEIDAGDSGRERGLLQRDLAQRIVVPFCPESTLSGIAHTDFMNVVWYRRGARIPAAWAGREVLLHFQAVDYDATGWATWSGASSATGKTARPANGASSRAVRRSSPSGLQCCNAIIRTRALSAGAP